MFRLGKEAVEVKYLVIGPEKFLASQRPDEAAVTRYYQENQEKFRLPTRVKVNYLLFKAKDFLEQAKVAPREVEDYLQEHQEEFTRPKEIRIRQLLLTVPPKASPGERQLVEKKAQDLLARTRAGEDFAGRPAFLDAVVRVGVADDFAGAVLGAVRGFADEFGFAVAVEVIDHELGVMGAFANVLAEVNGP